VVAALRQMGARPRALGASPPNAVPYRRLTPPVQLQAGLRYRIGFQQTFGYDPGNPISYRASQEMQAAFAPMFTVESLDPQRPAQYVPGVDQWIQPWILQGVAIVNATLDSTTSSQLLAVGVQSTGVPGTIVAMPPGSPQTTNWSGGKIVVWGLAIAVLGGVGWAGYQFYVPRLGSV
jgi:hypothetical protein